MLKVELKNISKSYTPGKPVLHPLDLCVEPGELFFLLGPSGCGKSTLLRLLAGFISPDTGSILFDGKDITNMPPEKRDAGLVFQNYALWPHMTVFDNVAFGLDTRKIKGEEKKKKVRAALEMVDMQDYADRRPASLSGGQQQRVALARAIAFRPKLLLLDEPLSNLDAKLRDSMRNEIRRICKEAGLTAIYVTHDRKEALSMGDRIAVINQGRIEETASPLDIYRRPLTRFSAEFMGSANFFPAKVIAVEREFCTLETPFASMRCVLPSFSVTAGNTYTAMIRPESLGISSSAEASNSFKAMVKSMTFQGETGIWEFTAGSTGLSVLEPCPPLRATGAECFLSVAPEHLVLLEDKR
ncbi:MAG: ABC transporter ATP-binding protein [Candidatus Izemoplasmatales bacterium]|nr:ABC transporter ATP-binding protein [Candidatus Izemoplasmatales bacterium]